MNEQNFEQRSVRQIEITPKLTYEEIFERTHPPDGKVTYTNTILNIGIAEAMVENVRELMTGSGEVSSEDPDSGKDFPLEEIIDNYKQPRQDSTTLHGMRAIARGMAPHFGYFATVEKMDMHHPAMVESSAVCILGIIQVAINAADQKKHEFLQGQRKLPGRTAGEIANEQNDLMLKYEQYRMKINKARETYYSQNRSELIGYL